MRNRKVIAVLLLGLMLTGCKQTPSVNPSVDNSLTSGDVTTSSDTTTSNDITTSIESSETATLGQVKGERLVGNNLVWDTVEHVSRYEVRIEDRITTVNEASYALTLSNFNPYEPYVVTVKATGEAGSGTFSEPFYFLVNANENKVVVATNGLMRNDIDSMYISNSTIFWHSPIPVTEVGIRVTDNTYQTLSVTSNNVDLSTITLEDDMYSITFVTKKHGFETSVVYTLI